MDGKTIRPLLARDLQELPGRSFAQTPGDSLIQKREVRFEGFLYNNSLSTIEGTARPPYPSLY
jgi:hypothetical protein